MSYLPRALRLTLLSLLVVGAGCAEERAPINRVQPNALAKSFFVGDLADPGDDPEFYMRTTVVDAAAVRQAVAGHSVPPVSLARSGRGSPAL